MSVVRPTSDRQSFWSLIPYAAVLFFLRRFNRRDRANLQRTRGSAIKVGEGSRGRGRRADELTNKPEASRNDLATHGRQASSPWEIPWSGWKDIFWRTYTEIGDDRLLAVAAGVVFYALLAIFPAITAIVSIYGLFSDAAEINEHLSLAAGFLPQGALSVIGEQATRIASTGNAKLGLGFVFGIGLALWSANAGMKAIIDALNVVYDETEKRKFIQLNLVSLTLTLGAILSLLTAIAAVVVLPLALNYLGLGGTAEALLRILRWPALFLLIVLALAVFYRFGPSRTKARWHWITPGSLFAAVAWLIASAALSWYLANFANYDATYGSLGAGIGLMMWLWISSMMILLGAELNSEIEHQTARDTTEGREKPLGSRGAQMADTVGTSTN